MKYTSYLWENHAVNSLHITSHNLYPDIMESFSYLFLWWGGPLPAAYGSYQARGQIGASAAGLYHITVEKGTLIFVGPYETFLVK